MLFARIRDGLVDGIVVADQEWVDSQSSDGFLYVPVPDGLVVNIGDSWSTEGGFLNCVYQDHVEAMGFLEGVDYGAEVGVDPDISEQVEGILAGE